ncbi:MAG: hypothetical protein A2Z99_07755 [Treponema sp. GWB1_62_6]|nr:MAG: hypothetical protein A2Z99_07755 [Treponema sp. GWB1_62_6]OHE68598.1 MAG: hypothetical protein A2001_05690 [Treponema sp. GWC1_61_84]OHE74135.1 MAG: hypothetical protein A2413_12970 [Treponema sp. RIFOXYC1_FULL_61_9]
MSVYMSRSRKPAPDILLDQESFAYAASSAARLSIRASIFGRRGPYRVRAAPVRFVRLIFAALLFVHLAFMLSTSLVLILFRTTNPAATTLMLYRKWAYGWEIVQPRFMPLARIPKSIRTMTVRVEDGSFYEHHGILLAAMKNAYLLNKSFGEPIYGGSTITMQTARTIFLVPEKSYLRKYLEAIIALEMEAILGKDRILELYFNYAEWGRGVFGIEAASRRHFKRGAAALERDEAIRLVTILSSPIRYGPYDFGRNGILRGRYAYLLKRFGDPPPAAELQPEPGAEPGTEPVPEPTLEPAEQPVGDDSGELPKDAGTPVQGAGIGEQVGGE